MMITLLSVWLAFASFDAASDIARRTAQEHHKGGLQLMQAEKYEEAIDAFRQAIAADPLLAMAHYNMGQSFMALKRYTEAGIAYQATKDTILRVNMLGERERAERDRASKDEISELRRTISAVRGGQAKVAQPEVMIIKLEERIRMLEGMEMRDRDVAHVPAEIELALGSAYFRQQKLKEAEKAYAAAVRQNNKLGAAHNNLAVIHMLSGRYAEARASIKAAEQAGFKVPPQLKADIEKREAGGLSN